MIWPPGIINHDLPEKNKYTNFKNIETIVYSELSDLKINKFVNFVKIHYLQNKDNTYSPKKKNILPYFNGHNIKSFFSNLDPMIIAKLSIEILSWRNPEKS